MLEFDVDGRMDKVYPGGREAKAVNTPCFLLGDSEFFNVAYRLRGIGELGGRLSRGTASLFKYIYF